MGLQSIEGKSTGIYREVTFQVHWDVGKRTRIQGNSRALKAFMKQASEEWDIHRVLGSLEKGALRIMKQHGGLLRRVKKAKGIVVGGEWLPLPSGAPPIAQRARQLIFEIWFTRDYLREGKCEDAAMAAYRVGRRAEMVVVSPFEPTVSTGAKVRRGNRAGGDWMKRKAAERLPEYQTETRRILNERPSLSWTRVCDLAGKKLGVSGKTIRNHTTDPRKSS